MKRTVHFFLLLTLICGIGIPQETPAGGEEGFGLQASIFRNAKAVTTDLNRNFSDALNYNLTPGDVFTLTLSAGIGLNATSANRAASYSIQLQEDFTLDIPVLGRVDARGKRIPELQRYIADNMKKMLALQHVSFNLAAPAQFNIFIYGNVLRPGFVAATPMNRLIDAIGTAGGFKANGTYRNIQLLRDGDTISLDISRFYSHADFQSNPYLRPGDKIFVPEADVVASIAGQVQFPGLYELIEGESLSNLIHLAGGLLPGAKALELQRISGEGVAERIVVHSENAQEVELLTGDRVLVRSISENVERITIEGAIYGSRLTSEGPVTVPEQPYRLDFPYYPGIKLLDILDGAGGPTPRALPDGSFLVRASTGEKRTLDIGGLWTSRDELLNSAVFPGDYIYIPLQRSEVFVSGSVQRAGPVPYVPGYSVSDYILFAGGIDENRGDIGKIYLVDKEGNRTPVTFTTELRPGDHVYVSKKWLFAADQTVQNVLVTTAWVTSVVTILTAVLEFVFTYVVTNPATQ